MDTKVDWRDYIVQDPDILVGKPTIRGTRISVELILDWLAEGWTREDLLRNYPSLNEPALQAALLYAAESVRRVAKVKPARTSA